jgi:hypothetical protein
VTGGQDVTVERAKLVLATPGRQGEQGVAGPAGPTGEPGVVISPTEPDDQNVLWADTSEAGDAVLPLGGVAGQSLVKVSGDDYDTTWADLAADLTIASASTGSTLVGLPNTFFVAQANRAFTQSALHFWPFVVNDAINVTDWFARVATNSSGVTETMRCGIYYWNADYTVGGLLQEFPLLNVPTGVGLYQTALSAPLELPRGRYAIAWNVSTFNLTLRTPQTTAAVMRMDQTNVMPARFRAGNSGTAPIASPLPDPVPAQPAIDTDGSTWGPAAMLIWSYA